MKSFPVCALVGKGDQGGLYPRLFRYEQPKAT
jgi:hypothetical protein